MDINITFETLFDILRRERGKEELQELGETFIADLQNYLAAKAELGDSKQMENVTKIIRELYEKRERKVLMLALNKARAGSDLAPMDRFLPSEKKLYEAVAKESKIQRDSFFSQIKSGKVEVKKHADEVKVRFLAPMPQFLGRNLQKFGPFSENEIVQLPPDIAEILVSKGRAEKAQ